MTQPEPMNPKRRVWMIGGTVVAAALVACAAFVVPCGPCGEAVAEANAADGKKVEAKVYVVHLPAPEVAAGAQVDAPIAIHAKPGWKWNKEYPARFVVSGSGVTVVPRNVSSKEVKLETEKKAILPLKVTGGAAGKGAVKIKASFSICSEESCEIIRNKEFAFDVAVK